MDNMIPELTLEPELSPELAPKAPEIHAAAPAAINTDMLTEAERRAVDEFAAKLDIADNKMILQYGAAAQKHIATFSEDALNSVKTKDMGEIGQTLSNLVGELKGVDMSGQKRGLFRRAKDQFITLRARYDKAATNVERIVGVLEDHQVTLLKDIALLDQMYDLNLKYYKELTMYILAGKKKLDETRAGALAQLKDKAAKSGLQEDAQAYNDLANQCNRFEKKLHDLELTRIVSIQMGPQTRLLQNNDALMVEKIQSSLVNTIPLWKSQMVLSLGLEHSREATAAQNAVNNMTNELLRKNAEMLRIGTSETAREAERSVIDIETLRATNQQLIATLDDVVNIQNEGAQKRKEAEVELSRIEGELKQKLLELRG
jgi:uncharacterized protein YaaN involved in tellurite resistance